MCGGNLRKRFELRVMTAFSLVWSSDEDKLRYAVDISSTRTTSSRTLFSTTLASVLAMTWVWFLNLDSGEVVETRL